MAIDETKIQFSSNWSTIDKVPAGKFTTTAVAANVNQIVGTYTSTPPMVTVQFKPTGSNLWYMPGDNARPGDYNFYYSSFFLSGNIYVNSTVAGTARLLIYDRKIT